VKHRRLIELDKRERRIVVEDTVESEDEHEVELFFHCAEDCQVEAIEGGYVIGRHDVPAVKLVLPVVAGASAKCTAAASRRRSAGCRAVSTREAPRAPSSGARGFLAAQCCARRSTS
jgi:hypothetical protein